MNGGPAGSLSSVNMEACRRCVHCALVASLLLGSSLQQDTVAADVSGRQLERLVELLTSKECEDLLFALSHPEEDVFQQLERLSAQQNPLGLAARSKRDAASAEDSGARCRAALTDWLLENGARTYYDRLARALQRVGRTDVAIVGKNINQDMALNIKHYVEDYHKFVSSLNVPSVESDANDHQQRDPRVRRRRVRDLTWRDLDLIVERAPVPPYQKGPMDVVLPLLHGLLLGFGGTFLASVSILLILAHVSRRGTRGPPGVTAGSGCERMVGDAGDGAAHAPSHAPVSRTNAVARRKPDHN
ncbi:transmembrane and death domain protein 1-like isoform X2 [Betta splendens]|uniref:Transmembrane and death domain protein 1-like isoform X2 n=1 Tax=Betta splendens TaxID=158456 RepID=A0A9W2XX43_BETSP|nr:transmembrane and death domain protein 1-like isoform X2 [Betta splendens]